MPLDVAFGKLSKDWRTTSHDASFVDLKCILHSLSLPKEKISSIMSCTSRLLLLCAYLHGMEQVSLLVAKTWSLEDKTCLKHCKTINASDN